MYRPRSIVRLMLFGFAVVLTPLVTAVITAIVQVDRLAEDSRAAVLEAEVATQQSRSLVEQLTEMQRAFGQFRVRGDDDFYKIYLERRAAFRNAVENLAELNLTELGAVRLGDLRRNEQALFARLNAGSKDPATPEEAAAAWAELGNGARAVLSESSRLIERQADYTTSTANDVQRILLLQAAAIIPATVVLAALFVVLVTRPMREIGQAIRRLGAREFSQAIAVRGPRDVEELGRQLDWLRSRIQELEHQKITFVRHISHELKTPLTTLREGSELLVESLARIAPEEAEVSRIMRDNTLHLQKLIEDLLQFGKTQELVTDLKPVEAVDLQTLIRTVVSAHAVTSGSKRIDIEQSLSPVRIRGDENKLRVVIDNLLANSIKYTPAGGRVSIFLHTDGEHAVVDVRDTGPGIQDDEQQKIFEPFQQGRAEYQSSVKGTGLGLAIAREYVEAHNGDIQCISSARGAHFRVLVPLAGPANAAAV